MKTPFTASLALLLFTAPAIAQSSDSARTNINPALLYYQAYILEPNLDENDWHYLETNEWKAPQDLDQHFGDLLGEFDKSFLFVRQAAGSKAPCDWGIDWTPGPFTLLPGLARAKGVALNANRRVKWDLQHGRQDDAREDLLAALALGRNITRDGPLISVLVQFAIENIIYDSVAENFGRFTPDQLQKIVDGLDATPARGTVLDILTSENLNHLKNWLPVKVEELRKANPGDERKVMDGIHELIAKSQGDTNLWPKVEKASGGTSDGVLRLLREYAEFPKQTAQVIALPGEQFLAKVNEFRTEVTDSPNPFIPAGVPAFLRAREVELRALTLQAEVRAAVKFKLHGQSGLDSISDPSGNGPFQFERFSFEGVDRGFKLTPAFSGHGLSKPVLIFVEKEGPPFEVDGQHPGARPFIPTFDPEPRTK